MPWLFNKILDRRIRGIVNGALKRAGSSANDQSVLWNAVTGDWLASKLAPIARDKYQHTGKEYLLYALTRLFRNSETAFVPHIQLHRDSIDAYRIPGGHLILTIHSAYAPCSKLALQAGRKVALLSNYPRTITRAMRQSGITDGQVELFAPDMLCFPKAHKYLQEGYIVNCTVDFRNKAARFESISDGFFQFAKRTGTPVFFATSVINDAGSIEYVCKGPYEGSSAQLLQAFQNFFSQYRPHVRMRLGSFHSSPI